MTNQTPVRTPQRPQRGVASATEAKPQQTTVCYRLAGTRLPLVPAAANVAERARRATLGRARLLFGAENIPVGLSGHNGSETAARHQHAFWLPFDANGDGRVDRLVVHAPMLDADGLAALRAADIAIYSKQEHWQAHLCWEGRADDQDMPAPILASGKDWASITPYYRPWHAKRGFVQRDMIRRECSLRGWPPLVEIERLQQGPPPPRWRWRRSTPPSQANGVYWRLVFEAPVCGPVALGYGCHFGLGLFGRAPGGHARRTGDA